MAFNFAKMFRVREKDVLPQYGASIEELGRLFSGDTHWSTVAELEQYRKSLYVFAAVNKIATKVAAVDWSLFKIVDKAGNRKEIFNHPILDLMVRPNPFQTKTEFLKITMINKKLTGEAFWLKIRNKRGTVVELWNLRPDVMTVVADPNKFILKYTLQKADGTKEDFVPEDVIHFKDPDPMNPFRGMSPVAVAKIRIETEASAVKFQRDFFRNNARPDALLVTEETLDTEQRTQMTSAWEEEHQGEGNSSRIGILEGGMKYQQVSLSQKEMDYIESSKFTRDDILVALGVPKGVITTENTNFANADAAYRMFLTETILPELNHITEVTTEMMIVPDFDDSLYLDCVDPTPSDRNSIRADHLAGFARWLTTNEIRNEYDLPPIEGGDMIATQSPDNQSNAVGDGGQPRLNPTDAGSPKKPGDPNAVQVPKPTKTGMPYGETPTSIRKTNKILQGRPLLRKRFELTEEILSELEKQKKLIAKSLKKKIVGEVGTESKFITIFPDQKTRDMYYELANKRIDKRSAAFRRALVVAFGDQRDTVLSNLHKLNKELTEGENKSWANLSIKAISINQLLNPSKEIKLFAAIALPFLEDYAQQGGEDSANLTGEEFDMSPGLLTLLDKRSKFFSDSVNETTFDKLKRTLSDGIDKGEGIADLTERVETVYGEIPEWRANTIARTETTYANNTGMMEQLDQSEVAKGKEWVATMDARTRDSHVKENGEIVAKDDEFSNGLQFPGDIQGPPSETVNCRCVLAPALFDGGGKMLKKKIKLSPIDKIIQQRQEKGGQGSGNHGHSGRPGSVGGSSGHGRGSGSHGPVTDEDRNLVSGGQQLTDSLGPLDPYETRAFGKYTAAGGHLAINSSLREGDPSDKDMAVTKLMDSGLEKLPKYEGAVYRGVSPADGLSTDEYVGTFERGKIFQDKAFLSTSSEPGVAELFAGAPTGTKQKKVIFKITSQNGRSISDVSSMGKDESEILFPRNTRFQVNDVTEQSNYHIVHMSEASSKASVEDNKMFMRSLTITEDAHLRAMRKQAPELPPIVYEN